MKRKPISTRTRFEIFKRDGFTCRYCGRKPPVVILQVDHVVAVANGGGENIENLVTSCAECNSGKSKVPLENQMAQIMPNVDLEREKMEQLREYNRALIEKQKVEEQWFREISNFWLTENGEDPSHTIIAGPLAASVRRFLKEMPAAQIIEAMRVTKDRKPEAFGNHNDYMAHKYFCGVCWHQIKGLKPWEKEGV